MNYANTDIITTQHGRFVLARGEHRQVKNCRTCRYTSCAMREQPCLSCRQARNIYDLADNWEQPVSDDVEEESMYYGGKPSKAYTERVIMQHMREIRDIAYKYVGKHLYLDCIVFDDGHIHAYNSASYIGPGEGTIDARCNADD